MCVWGDFVVRPVCDVCVGGGGKIMVVPGLVLKFFVSSLVLLSIC